jgi:hypothetical protein
MKATRANQTAAREYAERHDTGFCARSRELRAENERRTLGASTIRTARRETAGMRREREAVEFMRSIMSTPYAETRS